MLSTALFLITAFMVCMKLAPKNEWQSGFVIALILGLANYYANRIIEDGGNGINIIEKMFAFTFLMAFLYCGKVIVQEIIVLHRSVRKA